MYIKLLRPLHGWRQFAGEVGIIVVGVLVALAAQQIVEDLSWQRRANLATEALREEVADHYFYSVEIVMAQPCIDRLLALLEAELRKDSPRPATVYSDDLFRQFVYRAPTRTWSENKWASIVSEGVASHLAKDLRVILGEHYAQVTYMRDNNRTADQLGWRLGILGQPIEFDAGTRVRLSEAIAEARGRFSTMRLVGNQIIGSVQAMKLTPAEADLAEEIRQSGTLKFCRAHGLPIGKVEPQGP
ncbi:hypothetical protein [Sphingomonas alba]|uniref:Uncharacterized protein n=1 Tax=Sphingomonas alba TaxID=2908208 RepID=A0ABT0RP11_9SPHN|nr:hypothetical protein [Sphingomonas alba]MCL6684305.1 hypothetical protein [Sphingomonas alba]